MQRRDFLRAAGPLGLAGLAGCMGTFRTQSSAQSRFTTVENRTEKVYYPTHIDGMTMVGMGGTGRYKVGLMYSLPHAFWTITGENLNLARVGEDVTAHLMATLWDSKTETVLPTSRVDAEILKDGEEVDSRDLWPMLSQNMGYHFGDNVKLDGNGTYTARLSVSPIQARRMGDLKGAFGEQTTVEVEFEHSRGKLGGLSIEQLPDKKGNPGAIEPMDMKTPIAQVPKRSDLPNAVATGVSGDADFVAFAPDESPHFVPDGKSYLAVSARTPYNRYPLPFMSLSAKLTRSGSAVFDDILRGAVDPELGYHYGAAVESVQSGDSLTVTVDAPPQVARHEGYETAFVKMPKMQMTV
ncbi:iron transporter (plasmid) [Halorussus limi]|uniref:Iron transporter n=1 Tax=Halorussus limi TaxID=2938695 RepID=A0A8U0I0W6_9EURY|nr:iron transporter [Halorussus limi]UPV76551.1 iron transporter [Halorussus limi]